MVKATKKTKATKIADIKAARDEFRRRSVNLYNDLIAAHAEIDRRAEGAQGLK